MPKENPNNTGRGAFEAEHLAERNEAWRAATEKDHTEVTPERPPVWSQPNWDVV